MMPTLWQHNLEGVSNRWLSPAIWSTCPLELLASGRMPGFVDGDDFKVNGLEDGDDDTTLPFGYDRYIDTGNTIRFVSVTETNYFGALALITDGTDNDGPVIHRVTTTNAAGSNVSAPYVISDTAGAAFPLWFEARLKKSSVTDNQCAFAIGLSQGILDTLSLIHI